MPTALLRLASWRAGRSGLDDDLVHPRTGRPVPARHVVGDLLGHVAAALSDLDDLRLVKELTAALLERGNGSVAQRASFARTGHLRDVVLDAVIDGSAREASPGSVLGTDQER